MWRTCGRRVALAGWAGVAARSSRCHAEGPAVVFGRRSSTWRSISVKERRMELEKYKEKLLDGRTISKQIRAETQTQVAELTAASGVVPALGVVLVGGRTDSATYVRMKKRAAEQLGIAFHLLQYDDDVTEEELVRGVTQMNSREDVHGIIVQLPLPGHINERRVTSLVSLEKDVDGFHADNIGSLALKGVDPLFVPCTPRGVMEMLKRSGVELSGKKAVVLGRSNIDVEEEIRRADVVVAAIGKAEYVRGEWLKEGCVVVDVGMNRVEDASRKNGYRLTGDVHFPSAAEKASRITPVPGGVGPLTVAMLLKNTLDAAKRSAAAGGQRAE